MYQAPCTTRPSERHEYVMWTTSAWSLGLAVQVAHVSPSAGVYVCVCVCVCVCVRPPSILIDWQEVFTAAFSGDCTLQRIFLPLPTNRGHAGGEHCGAFSFFALLSLQCLTSSSAVFASIFYRERGSVVPSLVE